MKEESLEATQANVEREWIGRARALKPLLEAAAPRIEQAKTMPPDVLHALHNAQMFRMTTRARLAGRSSIWQLVRRSSRQLPRAMQVRRGASHKFRAVRCVPRILTQVWRKKSLAAQIPRLHGASPAGSLVVLFRSGWLDRERSLDFCEWQSDLPVAWWSHAALQRGR